MKRNSLFIHYDGVKINNLVSNLVALLFFRWRAHFSPLKYVFKFEKKNCSSFNLDCTRNTWKEWLWKYLFVIEMIENGKSSVYIYQFIDAIENETLLNHKCISLKKNYTHSQWITFLFSFILKMNSEMHWNLWWNTMTINFEQEHVINQQLVEMNVRLLYITQNVRHYFHWCVCVWVR